MPSKTFHNLDDQKKQRIIDSAKKEFDTFALRGAKVVRIIKRVNISRASFYKYFECIDELYYYILEDVAEGVISSLREELEKSDSDFVLALQNLFSHFINEPSDYTNSISKIFNVDFSESYMYAQLYTDNLLKQIGKIMGFVDNSRLRVDEAEDILEIISIVITIVERIIKLVEVGYYSKERALNLFVERMRILKHGIIRK